MGGEIREEAGGRFASTMVYKGWTIEAASGYDAVQDNFTAHLYLTAPGGRPKKEDIPLRFPSHEAAIQHAMNNGLSIVDLR